MIFEITPEDNTVTVDSAILAKLNSPVELALVSIDKNGNKKLLSVKSVEWRFVLAHPRVDVSLELEGLETKTKMTVGVIKVRLIDENVLIVVKLGHDGAASSDREE